MSDINGEDSGDVLPSGNQDLNNLPEEILDKMGSLRESGTTTDKKVDSDISDGENPTTGVYEELETGVKRKERSDEDFQTRKAPRIDDGEYWIYPDFMEEGEVRHRDGKVIRLQEIFPEISLSYADRCCKGVKTIDDFNNLILDLSQRDLSKEEGGKYSRKNAFDAEEDVLVSMIYESSVTNEQFDTLLHIFPDADPANLVEVCNTCAASQREFKTIVTNLVNIGKA